MMRSILLILHGGKNVDPAALQQAIAGQHEKGFTIEIVVTGSAGDAVRLSAEGAERGFSTIIAGGGDGTLNEVIRGIFQAGKLSQCSVGVLPLGTANDFAATLGYDAGDIQETINRILASSPVELDLGLVNGCPFVNMATAGFGTEVTSETPEDLKLLLGKAAYLLTGLRRFTGIASRMGTVTTSDLCWRGPFYVLAIGNGRQAGGGRELCPDALMDDGLLDLFLLPELRADQLLMTIPRLMTEGLTAIEHESFRHRAPWFEVAVPEGLHVNLDGEPLEGTSFRFEILPRALSFHVPRY